MKITEQNNAFQEQGPTIFSGTAFESYLDDADAKIVVNPIRKIFKDYEYIKREIEKAKLGKEAQIDLIQTFFTKSVDITKLDSAIGNKGTAEAIITEIYKATFALAKMYGIDREVSELLNPKAVIERKYSETKTILESNADSKEGKKTNTEEKDKEILGYIEDFFNSSADVIAECAQYYKENSSDFKVEELATEKQNLRIETLNYAISLAKEHRLMQEFSRWVQNSNKMKVIQSRKTVRPGQSDMELTGDLMVIDPAAYGAYEYTPRGTLDTLSEDSVIAALKDFGIGTSHEDSDAQAGVEVYDSQIKSLRPPMGVSREPQLSRETFLSSSLNEEAERKIEEAKFSELFTNLFKKNFSSKYKVNQNYQVTLDLIIEIAKAKLSRDKNFMNFVKNNANNSKEERELFKTLANNALSELAHDTLNNVIPEVVSKILLRAKNERGTATKDIVTMLDEEKLTDGIRLMTIQLCKKIEQSISKDVLGDLSSLVYFFLNGENIDNLPEGDLKIPAAIFNTIYRQFSGQCMEYRLKAHVEEMDKEIGGSVSEKEATKVEEHLNSDTKKIETSILPPAPESQNVVEEKQKDLIKGPDELETLAQSDIDKGNEQSGLHSIIDIEATMSRTADVPVNEETIAKRVSEPPVIRVIRDDQTPGYSGEGEDHEVEYMNAQLAEKEARMKKLEDLVKPRSKWKLFSRKTASYVAAGLLTVAAAVGLKTELDTDTTSKQQDTVFGNVEVGKIEFNKNNQQPEKVVIKEKEEEKETIADFSKIPEGQKYAIKYLKEGKFPNEVKGNTPINKIIWTLGQNMTGEEKAAMDKVLQSYGTGLHAYALSQLKGKTDAEMKKISETKHHPLREFFDIASSLETNKDWNKWSWKVAGGQRYEEKYATQMVVAKAMYEEFNKLKTTPESGLVDGKLPLVAKVMINIRGWSTESGAPKTITPESLPTVPEQKHGFNQVAPEINHGTDEIPVYHAENEVEKPARSVNEVKSTMAQRIAALNIEDINHGSDEIPVFHDELASIDAGWDEVVTPVQKSNNNEATLAEIDAGWDDIVADKTKTDAQLLADIDAAWDDAIVDFKQPESVEDVKNITGKKLSKWNSRNGQV